MLLVFSLVVVVVLLKHHSLDVPLDGIVCAKITVGNLVLVVRGTGGRQHTVSEGRCARKRRTFYGLSVTMYNRLDQLPTLRTVSIAEASR